MQESVFTALGTPVYCRHNQIDPSRPSLLLVHGLGESSYCFLEAFHSPLQDAFNLITPDLPGCGRSPPATDDDYRFTKQALRLSALLDSLNIDRTHLVGHSMGGDIGTMFCRDHATRILSFINIEGNLTSDNRFIVDQALAAEADNRFEDWLRQEFCGKQLPELCQQWPSVVRYLASLHLCESRAFLASVHEINRLLEPRGAGKRTLIGDIYADLGSAREFCWGSQSLGTSGQDFLAEASLSNREFENAFHWVMVDQPEQFYRYIGVWLELKQS